jgi:N-acyl-phosphatidylethanolamine-hydrolysing phospholipase D
VRALVAAHPSATWCVPLGIANWLRARHVDRIVELDWWQTARIRDLDVACTPARHFSGRRAFSRDETLWASWCLTGPSRRVHFGGDTAYHPEFRRIALTCGPFDVVLLPVGAYNPRSIMQMVHMDPDEAIQAWRDIADTSTSTRPPVFIPIHWGTFKLTDEPMDEPPRRLKTQWEKSQLPTGALRVLMHGETWML